MHLHLLLDLMLVESALYLIVRINAPLMCRAQANLPLDVGVKYANGIPRMLQRIAGIITDWLESKKMCSTLKRLIKPIISAMSNMDTHAKKWLNLCSEPNHLHVELY